MSKVTRSRDVLRILMLLVVLVLLGQFVGCATGGAVSKPTPAGESELQSMVVMAGGMTALLELPHERGVLAARGRQVLGVTQSADLWIACSPDPPTPWAIITDLCFEGDDLVIIWGDLAVDRCRRADAMSWDLAQRWTAEDLGIHPRAAIDINGALYISGDGGVVNTANGTQFLDGMTIDEPVCETALGIVACAGRRAYTIHDGAYVGSASSLERAGNDIVFLRQGQERSEFGFMDLSLRERNVESQSASTAHRARAVFRKRDGLLVVCDDHVESFSYAQNYGRHRLELEGSTALT
ncbi:MAG: hypothetical protein KC983_12385, partial [Phycisphaerales bacterium]|nr:hypothetical protein [Phycisphaerales bacterium]